jgi:glycerol-3-phosphate cytidylyltransferase
MKRGFICGAFDLLHSGHLYTFRMAHKYCDTLIVGLQVDPSMERPGKNKPVETIFERFNRLDACKYVDGIIPYETDRDLLNLLDTGNFDVRFLDENYLRSEDIIGKGIVQIKFISRQHDWSSSDLRKKIENGNK